MTILNKGGNKKTKITKPVIQHPPIIKNALLDTLFTFVGVSSECNNPSEIMISQMKMLNLFSTSRTNASR